MVIITNWVKSTMRGHTPQPDSQRRTCILPLRVWNFESPPSHRQGDFNLFAKLDANHDGSVSKAEWRNFLRLGHAERGKKGDVWMGRMIHTLSVNVKTKAKKQEAAQWCIKALSSSRFNQFLPPIDLDLVITLDFAARLRMKATPRWRSTLVSTSRWGKASRRTRPRR